MKRHKFSIYTSVLIVLAVVGTIVHGRLTDRWGGNAAALQAAAERLQLAPRSFGDWELQSETQLDERVKRILDCASSWNRKYVNRTTGQVVSVAMIVGPPGPTSAHFAEMCYTTQGFQPLGKGSRFQLDFPGGNRPEFFEDNFISPGMSAQRLRVCYSWRGTGRWLVPTVPRVTFGDRPFLYKIQVAANLPLDTDAAEDAACRAFLMDFLPALDGTVFRTPAD